MAQMWTALTLLILFVFANPLSPEATFVASEICDNARDDDNDGLIDLNDPDCLCEIVDIESLIPNPSFEEYRCCPDGPSLLSCAESWDQASFGSTDFVHKCGYISPGAGGLMPFPDGEGILLFLTGSVIEGNQVRTYKEYAGACLNRPMRKDSVYKIKFHIGFADSINSPPINFVFYGSSSCDNLPFSTTGTDCPINYPGWRPIHGEIISPGPTLPGWVELTVIIQPQMDINALVLGGDCNNDPENKLRIYYLDNLRLNDESHFDFELVNEGSPCSPDFAFAVAENPAFAYQWYKEGIALIDETAASLSRMYGEGSYQLRIIDNMTYTCRIADNFVFALPSYSTEVHEAFCEGESLMYQGDIIDEEGVYTYQLSSVEGCDSIVTLYVETRPIKQDTTQVNILPGATYSIAGNAFSETGMYTLHLTSADGCDSIVELDLKELKVYTPNAFSPNGDGINEYFEIAGPAGDFLVRELSIFDRWGRLLFKGEKWDGKLNNQPVAMGVYVYRMRLVDRAGHELQFSNTLTLLR